MAIIETAALSFRNDLMLITKNLIWKDHYQVAKYETFVDDTVADSYTWAAKRILEEYPVSTLKKIIDYDDSTFEILLESSSDALKKPLKTVRTYTEENDYYRKLAGLPPHHNFEEFQANETDYYIRISELGLPPNIVTSLGIEAIENTGYLHELNSTQIAYIENTGYLDAIRLAHDGDKNYDYLNYMTEKKIYPFVARIAQDFDILYIPKSKIPSLTEDFIVAYEASKRFIIQRYYTDAFRNRYALYEGFMGLAMLFMTLQKLNVMYLDTDITREFYDLDSIKVVYQAYSVPFYEDIPVKYHSKIVKAINRLLSYKGSNHIFFDLAALFDFGKLNIFQYYLMKKQILDETGQPVFVYNDLYDSKGRFLEKELDYEKTYEINFVRRTIRQESPYEAVNKDTNYLDYEPVILDDPYWLDDADLREKMYQSEYNFIETKYIGFETQISMTKYFYESIYFLRMLFDNRDVFSQVAMVNNKLGTDMTIFNAVIYLHALICKKLGWMQNFDMHTPENVNYLGEDRCKICYGEIPHKPTQMAKIMGYNFKADMQLIINECLISDSKHSIIFTDDKKNGYYFYPIPDEIGTEPRMIPVIVVEGNEEVTKHVPVYRWESLTIYVYEVNDGNIVRCYGSYKGYDRYVNSIRGGIGYGLNSNARDIIKTSLSEVCGLDNLSIELLFSMYKIKINDASIDLFDNNLEKMQFINMINAININDVITVNAALGIQQTYDGIIAIREFIENKLLSVNDKEVYMAYRHLYRVLMTHDIMNDVITKSSTVKEPVYKMIDVPVYEDETGNIDYELDEDGRILYDGEGNAIKKVHHYEQKIATRLINGEEIPIIDHYIDTGEHELAESYADLLEDLDKVLFVRLMNIDTDEKLRDEIDYILIELQRLCNNLTYLNMYGSYNREVVTEYLYKLIMFFKSVKVQLLDFNVIWVFDSRADNMLKLLTEFRMLYRKSTLDEEKSLAIATFDFINHMYDLGLIDESLTAKDVMLQFAMLVHLKSLVLKDEKIYANIKEEINAFTQFFDVMAENEMLRSLAEELDELRTLVNMIDEVQFNQFIHMKSSRLFTEFNKLYFTWRKTILCYTELIHFNGYIAHVDMYAKLPPNENMFFMSSDAAHQSMMIGPNKSHKYGYVLWDDDDARYYINAELGQGALASEALEGLVFDTPDDAENPEALIYNPRDDYIVAVDIMGDNSTDERDLLDLWHNRSDGAGKGVFSTEDFFGLYFENDDFQAPHDILRIGDKIQGHSAENGFTRAYKKLQDRDTITFSDLLELFDIVKKPSSNLQLKDLCMITHVKIENSEVAYAVPDHENITPNDVHVLATEDNDVIVETIVDEWDITDPNSESNNHSPT